MARRGTNQEFGRPYNRQIVLETVRLHGPITRVDVARRVGLTLQTVSTIAGELVGRGLVRQKRREQPGRGYPAPALEIDPDGGHAIGLVLTPRGLQAALVNLAGDIVARAGDEAPNLSPEVAFPAIRRLAAPLAARAGGSLLGAGIAMPGPFDVEAMSFVGPTTMEGWRGVDVPARLAETLGLPAWVEGDHAAAATGEEIYGAGIRHASFYYLYFGVGVGGCMVEDGVLMRGAHRNAGEIGHLPLVPDGEPCPCGNRGCLERYVSLEAWERRAGGRSPADFAREVAPIVRAAVVTIENLYDPETIVIGGTAPAELLAAIVAAAEPLPGSVAARAERTVPRLTLSASGPDAVLRGAAALAVAGALSPRIGAGFPALTTVPAA